MYAKRFWIIAFVLSLLLALPMLGQAQDGMEIPQVTIEATADGLTLPENIPEGVVTVTFQNNSDAPFGPLIVRLSEGITLEDVEAIAEDDPEAGMQAIFEGQLSLLGAVTVMPEMAVDVTFDFSPGTYLLANTANEEQGGSFTVVDSEGEGAAPPDADVEAVLLDFAFGMPIEVPAGPQLWHIQNPGAQPHQMIVISLDDALTAGGFNQLLLQIGSDEGEEPETVIYWDMSPGEQVWITYDLEPGTYGVVCAFPDTSGSGHVHAELGMRQIIIVTE